MIVDIERFNWTALRSASHGKAVPQAILAIQAAKTLEDAERASRAIDNTVMVQGALYEMAAAATVCLVSGLFGASPEGRPAILELLVLLGSGEPASSETATLADECRRAVALGLELYMQILASTDRYDEVSSCIDLLSLSADVFPDQRRRCAWHVERARRHARTERQAQHFENILRHLA